MIHDDLADENGFLLSAMKHITSAMAPGKELDAMNRRAVELLSEEVENVRENGITKVGLWQWSHQIMTTSTTEAVWGSQNPYRDAAIADAWR